MSLMRNGKPVSHAILHCAAVGNGWTASRSLYEAHKEITQWHKAQGWADIGYHYIIGPTGDYIQGRPLSRDGAHTLGHNKNTLGILLLESKEVTQLALFSDYFTEFQRNTVCRIMDQHGLTALSGHNDYAAKLCPGFSVSDEFPTVYKKHSI